MAANRASLFAPRAYLVCPYDYGHFVCVIRSLTRNTFSLNIIVNPLTLRVSWGGAVWSPLLTSPLLSCPVLSFSVCFAIFASPPNSQLLLNIAVEALRLQKAFVSKWLHEVGIIGWNTSWEGLVVLQLSGGWRGSDSCGQDCVLEASLSTHWDCGRGFTLAALFRFLLSPIPVDGWRLHPYLVYSGSWGVFLASLLIPVTNLFRCHLNDVLSYCCLPQSILHHLSVASSPRVLLHTVL